MAYANGAPLTPRMVAKQMKTEPSEYELEERERYLTEMRNSGFLDAVFLMLYYNRQVKRWGPPPKPDDISIAEAFPDFDEQAYRIALERSNKLLNDGSFVGEAHFNYPNARYPAENPGAELEKQNPGFGKRCYDLSASAGIVAMR